MTYSEFVSQFSVFDNPPCKKGYDRHHIVPEAEQIKMYGSVIDERQIYVSLPQHMWAHILYDREHGTKTAKRFLNTCGKPAEFFDCWEKCLAYSYTLRKKKEERDKKQAEVCRTTEHRQNQSDSRKEVMKNPEVRQKVSDYMKEVMKNPEVRQKIADSMKGRHFYNNGVKNVRAYSCPEGFIPGRLKKA